MTKELEEPIQAFAKYFSIKELGLGLLTNFINKK